MTSGNSKIGSLDNKRDHANTGQNRKRPFYEPLHAFKARKTQKPPNASQNPRFLVLILNFLLSVL